MALGRQRERLASMMVTWAELASSLSGMASDDRCLIGEATLPSSWVSWFG